jgi:hypothetical protein
MQGHLGRSSEHGAASEHGHGRTPVRGGGRRQPPRVLGFAGAPSNPRARGGTVVVSGGDEKEKGGVLDGDGE